MGDTIEAMHDGVLATDDQRGRELAIALRAASAACPSALTGLKRLANQRSTRPQAIRSRLLRGHPTQNAQLPAKTRSRRCTSRPDTQPTHTCRSTSYSLSMKNQAPNRAPDQITALIGTPRRSPTLSRAALDHDVASPVNILTRFRERKTMIVSWMTTNQVQPQVRALLSGRRRTATAASLQRSRRKAMIEQIARAGFKIMIFSGGEPLMRDDIFELVAHAAAQGLRPVFGSNGTLITDEVARKLKEAGACSMGISIDSLDAAKHDAFRGVAGAHADTLAGIEACKRAGLDFQIHTTVVDWNRNEICDITRLRAKHSAR